MKMMAKKKQKIEKVHVKFTPKVLHEILNYTGDVYVKGEVVFLEIPFGDTKDSTIHARNLQVKIEEASK